MTPAAASTLPEDGTSDDPSELIHNSKLLQLFRYNHIIYSLNWTVDGDGSNDNDLNVSGLLDHASSHSDKDFDGM